MNFTTLEVSPDILRLRDWINQRSDYLTTKEGLKALCRKIFGVTGIKFDGRWGERNLLEHVQAFMGAVSSAVSLEEVEPEDTQTATVTRIAGRLSSTEKFLFPFVELADVSCSSESLTDPGFTLTKKLWNLDLKAGDRITFAAKISIANGCFTHPKIINIERPNKAPDIVKVLRLAKPFTIVHGRSTVRPVASNRLPNTYGRNLLAKITNFVLRNCSDLVRRSPGYV
ncbi:MAG: hypothetical protein AAFS12_00105 [Cyanobacteria bacterium J06632_19]